MANDFTKEEIVMFEQVLEGFDDWLVISKNVELYNPPNAQTMERGSDRIWRPMPYIGLTYDGFDQSANFGNITQLAVPITLGYHKSAPLTLSSKDLRDPNQLEKYGMAAKQKLASDVNTAVYQQIALQGSKVYTSTSVASGFDDVAALDTIFNDIGVDTMNRSAFYSSFEYNKMAANLASRTLDNSKSLTAYDRAYVGDVAGFDVFKNDQKYRLTLAAGVTVKVNGANQYYVPVGHTTQTNGTTNVDNRYQTITISVGSGTVKVGDRFKIAGVNSVHMITKQDTGNPQTFCITSIVTGAGGSGTVQITPPIISAGGGSRAELEYQNVSATPADQAVITFLNTATATANPFFKKEAIEIMPGSFAVEPQDGWGVLQGTTDLGIPITYVRQGAINDLSIKARWDIDFGVGILNTEMCGISLFQQV